MGIQINGQTDTVTAIDGSLNVGGDVNVPGVLTYDDVTNIDSVGVITARNAIVISEDNAIHFRGTAADDVDAILRASAGGGQLLINSRNDTIINIDSNNDSTDAHFAVAHGAATGSSTELIRVQENGLVGIGTDIQPTTRLQIGDGTADLNNVIKFGKRTPSTQSNLPLIGHYSHNGQASGLGLCATSTSGGIHFFTGNNASGFDVGINSERMRIHHDGVIQTFNHAECLAYKNDQSVTGGDGSTHELGVDTFYFNRGGYTITSENIVVPKTGMYRCIIRWESMITSSDYSIRAIKCLPRVGGSISGNYTDHWHSVAKCDSNNTHWSFSDMYYLDLDANDQIDAQMQWYPYASRTEDIDLSISLFYIG